MKSNLIIDNTILNIIHKKYREAAVEAAKDDGRLINERLVILSKLYNGVWESIRESKDIHIEIIDSWMVLQVHRLLLEQRNEREKNYDPAMPIEIFDVIANEIFKEIMDESIFH